MYINASWHSWHYCILHALLVKVINNSKGMDPLESYGCDIHEVNAVKPPRVNCKILANVLTNLTEETAGGSTGGVRGGASVTRVQFPYLSSQVGSVCYWFSPCSEGFSPGRRSFSLDCFVFSREEVHFLLSSFSLLVFSVLCTAYLGSNCRSVRSLDAPCQAILPS